FRDYDHAGLAPRIRRIVRAERLTTISGLQEKIIHDASCMDRFLIDICRASEEADGSMFDDPEFFFTLRRKVVPRLRTYPFIRIWQIGCGPDAGGLPGSAAYSMAILMWEEGLYDRCKIYVSDVSETLLEKAKEGIVPLDEMKEYSRNNLHYLESGGRGALSNFYTANGNKAILHPKLKRNLVFSQHSFVTDGSFNEFNVVLCRNAMELFNPSLKERVYRLLHQSICPFGILGLGRRDSLSFSPHEQRYAPMEGTARLYERIA
ncbi:MAG: CheR family methyltransferase, partial [Acidobacteriota bacterium]